MTDIDKAVELAQMHMRDGHVKYDTGQCEVCRASRAVLAMARLVEAARQYQTNYTGVLYALHTNEAKAASDRDAMFDILNAEARRG